MAWPVSVTFRSRGVSGDSSGQFVDQSRRWPFPTFGGDICHLLEVGAELPAVELAGETDDDGAEGI